MDHKSRIDSVISNVKEHEEIKPEKSEKPEVEFDGL